MKKALHFRTEKKIPLHCIIEGKCMKLNFKIVFFVQFPAGIIFDLNEIGDICK